ncbi:hypothetical protein ORJ66_20780, partial [Pseudoalteromonas tunicata]|uniref:hypothetical protein n=1 Tax=Pseudoalteromonas tunicata TaxID=314281 RepID=UPI00273F54CB
THVRVGHRQAPNLKKASEKSEAFLLLKQRKQRLLYQKYHFILLICASVCFRIVLNEFLK